MVTHRDSASLTTWSTQLTTLESRAAEHDKFGDELVRKVADPMKVLAAKYEEIRKRHVEYAEKLEKERDSSYSDLKKMKGKYDSACQDVENKRKKTESAFDISKTKSQNAYQQQISEMNNVKNSYIINIRITNRQKELYYHEYVPDLLDSLQDLNEIRVTKLNGFWSLAADLENVMLKKSSEYMTHLSQQIPRNVPTLDSMMYVRHNVGSWQEPSDKAFEASPLMYDDEQMIVDEQAKIVLRNILSKSKAQLGELRREVDIKRKELEAAKKIKQQMREGKDKRSEVQFVSAVFNMQESLHEVDRKRLTAEVEVATITSAVGDVTLGTKSHNFKGQTFKIPTNCDLCGDRIWGLSAKGFDCRDCGYTCHSKCEMKVPAECPGELTKEEKKKIKIERQERANSGKKAGGENAAELPALSRSDTMNSLSSGYAASANRSLSGLGPKSPSDEAPIPDRSSKPSISGPSAPRKNRMIAPPPAAYVSELPGSSTNGSYGQSDQQMGRMVYAYDANGPDEISVPEGGDVIIIEPDGLSIHDPV